MFVFFVKTQAFRLSRALHRLITGNQWRAKTLLSHASLENIYRQQGGRGRDALSGVRQSKALSWGGETPNVPVRPPQIASGARAVSGDSVGAAFGGVDPWNEL